MKIRVEFSKHITYCEKFLEEFSDFFTYTKSDEKVYVLTPWKDKYLQNIIEELEPAVNKGDLIYKLLDK